MPIISVCLIVRVSQNYEFLENQNWTDVELVIAGNKNIQNIISDSLYQNSTTEVIKQIETTDNNTLENTILQHCEGEYIIWLEKDETWSPDFLIQLKDYIFSHQKSEALLYGLGFTRDTQQIKYSPDIYPFLKENFSMTRVFLYPYYFIPFVKFIWKRSLIHEYNLMFDTTLESHLLRIACFNLDYVSTIYQNNAYNEIKYIGQALSFYLPVNNQHNSKFLPVYQERVLNKSTIFRANPWTKLYWHFLFAERILKKKLSIKDV